MTLTRASLYRLMGYKFLMNLYFFSGILIPFFMDWGGLSFFQIMILQAFFVLATFFLEVPMGAFSDYFGRKWALVSAAVVMMLAAFTYSMYPCYALFFLAEFFLAIGFTLVSGTDEAMVYDTLLVLELGSQATHFLGRYQSIEIIAIMVAAPVGSFMASQWGMATAVRTMIVPFFLAFLLALTIKEPPYRQAQSKIGYFQTIVQGMRYFKRHRLLRVMAFDRITIAAAVFMVVWLAQTKLKLLQFPIGYFGLVTMTMTAAQSLVLNSFHLIKPIFGSYRRYLLLSALVSGVGFICLGFTRSVTITIVLCVLIAGFGLSRFVLFQGFMNPLIPSHQRATVISTVSMFNQLAKGMVYLVFGLLTRWSFDITMWVIGLFVIVCALASQLEERDLPN